MRVSFNGIGLRNRFNIQKPPGSHFSCFTNSSANCRRLLASEVRVRKKKYYTWYLASEYWYVYHIRAQFSIGFEEGSERRYRVRYVRRFV